jgi:hypothetical protein
MKIITKKSDIKVKDYLNYVKYIESLNENDITEEYVIKNTVKIFYNIDTDKHKYKTIYDLYKLIEITLKEKQDLVTKFKFKGKTYAINPNFDDISMAEWVDLDTDDIIQQICVMYRPIKQKFFNKYTITPYNADIEIYNELKEWLTLDIYIGFVNFFLKINEDLLNFFQSSLMEDQDLNQEQKKNLQKNGYGTPGWMDFATTIFLN